MTIRKRILSLLLSIAMLVGLLPVQVLATDVSTNFSDVRTSAWFYDAVQYAYDNGMMIGTGNRTFSPEDTATRGMIVTILHRIDGTPSASGENFNDVAEGRYYSDAVSWASANGIVNGYGDGKFGPNDPITREQMATILYRYAQYKGYDVSRSADLSKYTDADQISNSSKEGMIWANAEGLIIGVTTTALAPQDNATRAQVAMILMRFCNVIISLPLPDHEYTVDSDNDGISDELEAHFGTNKDDADTDSDGFDDFAEIYLMGTDPLVPDDPNKDTDGDGLNDSVEVNKYQTDINSTDTDCDGLSDFDEIMIYGTDPTKADSDDDGLSDGFEVDHGLNPTMQCTNGITNDGNVPIDQTLEDNGISLDLKNSSNLALPSIHGIATGEMADHVFLASSSDSAFEDNRAIVGSPVNIEGSNEYVSGLTLSFDVSAYEGDTENLSICIINDEGVFEPVDTTANGNDISCTLSGNGTYFVLNVNQFLKTMGINLDYIATTVTASTHMTLDTESITSISSKSAVPLTNTSSWEPVIVSTALIEDSATNSYKNIMASHSHKSDADQTLSLKESSVASTDTIIDGQADIVFVVDTTGSMYSAIDNVVENISTFASTLSNDYNVQINYGLISFKDLEEDGADTTVVVKNGSSNWFSSTNDFVAKLTTVDVDGGGDYEECGVDALETARQLDWRTSANKFIVLVTDADYKVSNRYDISSMDEEIALLTADNINVSVITTSTEQGRYQSLYETTCGIFADIYDDFSTVLMSLADLIGQKTSDGSWVILKHGYRYVNLPEIPTAESTSDYDGDGYTDYFELGESEVIDLSALIKLVLFSKGIPFEAYTGKSTIVVYNAYSDPTKIDTDNDGIPDKEDTAPWTIGLEGNRIGTLTIVSCYTNQSGTGGWTKGHAFLVHNSLINNTIDFSSFIAGCETDGAWSNLAIVDDANSAYSIKRDSFLSIGGFQSNMALFESSSGDGNGVYYNYEFYSYFTRGVTYLKNAYLTKDITYTQMQKLVSYCSQDSVNYWSGFHNCSTIACDSWNEIYGTELTAKGLYGWHIFDTPTELKDSILKESDGKTDYQIADILN